MASLLELARSATIDLDGPVHYREWDGPPHLTFVCVHGLGGSSLNWMSVAPELSRRGRVLAPDLPGFGYSPRAGRRSTLSASRRLVSRFVAETSSSPVVLVGSSMGGALSMLQAAYEPRSVRGLVLTSPALPLLQRGRASALVVWAFAMYQVPRLGDWFVKERARRMGPERLVRQTLDLCCVDASVIPDEVVEAHVEMARERAEDDDAIPAFLEAARSLVRFNAKRRFTRAVMDRIEAPVLIVHGGQDRLVPPAHARAAVRGRPAWDLEVLDQVGHAAMLEAPDRWLTTVDGWLRRGGIVAEASAAGVS